MNVSNMYVPRDNADETRSLPLFLHPMFPNQRAQRPNTEPMKIMYSDSKNISKFSVKFVGNLSMLFVDIPSIKWSAEKYFQ